MKKIIMIGGGGHAKVIIGILKKMKEFNILGYTDKNNNGEILGIGYLGTDENITNILSKYGELSAVFGIGKLVIDKKRKKIFDKLKISGIQFPSIIAPTAIINEEVEIGEGTVVMDGVVINPGVEIGKLSIVNTQASIDHDCWVGNDTHIAPGVTISGGVKIGNNCIIGVGSTIIQSISVCDNAFIGGASIVIKDINKKGLYVGNPLRKIK
ncbi:MAG: acetyltransferase [Bacteroidetes bacterium]|nr:acetyltransferase [Bacteroidota bacterium]